MRNFVSFATSTLLVIFTAGCAKTDKKIVEDISHAEGLVLISPDSAAVVLDMINPDALNDRENTARYRLIRTITNDRLGIPHESPDDVLAARDYFASNKTTDSLLSIAHLYVGRVYEDLGQPEKALESYLSAKSTADNTTSNHYWKGRINYHIGSMYHNYSDYLQSANYIEQAIPCFTESGNSMYVAHCYNLLGRNHKLAGDHQRALATLEKANEYYIANNYADGLMSNALIMSGILLEEYDGAYHADSLVRQVHSAYNGGIIPVSHYPMMSRIEEGKGNFRKAIRYLEDYIARVPDLPLAELASYKYLLADYYNELGQTSPAYGLVNEYVALRDSLHQNNVETVLQEVEKKYEKQQLENEYLAYRKVTAYRILIGSLLFVVAIGVMFLVVRRRRQRIVRLQADLDKLRYETNEFDDLKNTLTKVLDTHTAKEARLQEVLLNKMRHLQDLVDCLHIYENDYDKFKKKILSTITKAERDTYFGELHEIVNERHHGIVDYLKRKFTTLAPDELDFCCLSCLGFTNNQLGILFGLTSHASVYNKRHKIKQKIVPLASDLSFEECLRLMIAELKNENGTE
jgi:tetratricopeptide (TPR) repeat protein